MPSSKRARVVPTSKTRKNRKELVRRLAAKIQQCATDYGYIYVFDVQNMRSTFLKQVRTDMDDSHIIMGKTKVMMVALGRDAESEVVPGVSALQPYVTGEVGLLFTNRGREEVGDYFDAYVELDYARSGSQASADVRIPPGPIYTQYGVAARGEDDDPLPLQIEPQLRKLGVPTRIKAGKVVLEDAAEGSMADNEGYLVCSQGDTLDSRQTTILKILGVRMSEFKIGLRAVYDKEQGVVSAIGAMEIDSTGT
ncbi:hypothetical protein DV736_g3385, partial [Chaetothyriales sp. CBS 134916]